MKIINIPKYYNNNLILLYNIIYYIKYLEIPVVNFENTENYYIISIIFNY